MASASTNDSTFATKLGQTSSSRTAPRAPGGVEAGLGPSSDLGQPRVAADGKSAAPDDLHPGVLLRVVRGGDADPAVEAEFGDGVVQHLGPDEPEPDDVGACVRRPSTPAAYIAGDDTRMSCPRATARGSNCSAYARAIR